MPCLQWQSSELNVITWNKNQISFDELFCSHFYVPQRSDRGAQYRTAAYYHSNDQKIAIEATIKKIDASGTFTDKVVTQVEAYSKFWMAEDYHQDYFELNPGNPYIIQVAIPKVKKLKKYFPGKIKAKYKAEK